MTKADIHGVLKRQALEEQARLAIWNAELASHQQQSRVLESLVRAANTRMDNLKLAMETLTP